MKKIKIPVIIEGYYPFWEEGVSLLYLTPTPPELKLGDTVVVGKTNLTVVQVDLEEDEIFIRGCAHIPRGAAGFVETTVEKESFWKKVKKFLC